MTVRDFIIAFFLAVGIMLGSAAINFTVEHFLDKKNHKTQKSRLHVPKHKEEFKNIPKTSFQYFKAFCYNEFINCKKLDDQTLEFLYYDAIPSLTLASNKIRRDNNLPELPQDYYAMFLLSWINKESSFNKMAWSNSNALGLLQIKHEIWCKYFKIHRSKLFDPKINIKLAIKIFLLYLKQQKGYIYEALASYNAGPRRKHLKDARRYARQIMSRAKKLSKEIFLLKTSENNILAFIE